MRLLHTMLRVGDLQRSIEFYTNVLGMKLLCYVPAKTLNTSTLWLLSATVLKPVKP